MPLFESILKLRKTAEGTASSLPPIMMQAQLIASNILHGAHGQRKSGTGEKFWQFREYEQSDRPQDIDWRQSAKTDDVFIKQHEWQATQKTYLWCAGGKSMDFSSNPAGQTKLETAQIMALSLALLLRAGEEHIGVFGNHKTGRGDHRFEMIADYLLSRKDIEESTPAPDLFSLPCHAAFIALGDFLDDPAEIERNLAPLAAQTKNGIIIQILDPCEINLSYNGRVRFEGINPNDETLVNNVSSIRSEYENRIAKQIKAVEDITHHYGWTYKLHRTDDDIAKTLQQLQYEISTKTSGGAQ